jgi:hypothetical protein
MHASSNIPTVKRVIENKLTPYTPKYLRDLSNALIANLDPDDKLKINMLQNEDVSRFCLSSSTEKSKKQKKMYKDDVKGILKNPYSVIDIYYQMGEDAFKYIDAQGNKVTVTEQTTAPIASSSRSQISSMGKQLVSQVASSSFQVQPESSIGPKSLSSERRPVAADFFYKDASGWIAQELAEVYLAQPGRSGLLQRIHG